MANLGDISKINLPNGNVVNIKDTTARAQVLKIAKEDTGRNCFNNIATTATKNNITFTVNADKSVTLTATQAASADVYFELGYYTGDGTTRKLMGAPSGSSTSKWWLFGGNGVDDVGSGVNITNSSTIYIIVKSGQTPNNVTFKPMITTQAWLDAVFTEYQPYALPNTKITPELIELVDSGAKNLVNSTSGSGTRWIDIPVDIPAGEYAVSFATLSTTWEVSANQLQISFMDSNYDIVTDGYTYINYTTKNGVYKLNDTCKNIRLYASPTSVSGKVVTYTNMMLCTKAAWDVSQKYVPYGMSNAELTNNISITDITANFTAATGYTIQPGISSVYRQGKHVFGTLSIKIDSGNLPTTSTTVATNKTDKPNSATLLPCGCGVDEWRIDSIGTCYYSQYTGEIQCKDTVTTNKCFNLQLNYLTF